MRWQSARTRVTTGTRGLPCECTDRVDRDTRALNPYGRWARSGVPLALVVVSLLGSLAIPARQTWLISQLLHQSTHELAPSRMLVERLQTNVAQELSALQSYAISGNLAPLSSYRVMASDDEQSLVTLEQLASHFGPTVASQVHSLRARVGALHQLTEASIQSNGNHRPTPLELSAANALADSSLRTITALSSELATAAAARDRRLSSLEQVSIVSNAVLVVATLLAVAGVGILTVRERRLASENVRLLEETRDRQLALSRAIQSRSRLMRGFSHDVKNPIGAADGFAELLSVGVYGELSAAQQVSVDRMRLNMRRAISLIDELHDLSHVETGNVAVVNAPVDLAVLARSLGEEYNAAARAHGLSLSVELPEEGPIVETNEARVRQIAANLLSNAIKYTKRGTVTLRIRHQPASAIDATQSWAALEVEDSGIGIPADKQEYIFEEFSRLGVSDSAGAGLGLAISRLLAQRLGGRISVSSDPGRGSTFTLWLPMGAADSR